MNRRSLSLSQIHHSWWLAPLLLLALAGCTPATVRYGRPTRPVRAQAQAISAEVVSLTVHDGGVYVAISVKAPPGARLMRAALAQPRRAQPTCRPNEPACDFLDSRFTTGTTALVLGSQTAFLLHFPSYGGRRELDGKPQLLLDFSHGTQRVEVELDLAAPGTSYRTSEWGLGGAMRYRLRGTAHARLGDTYTLALGAERWLGSTRLHLGYEIGFSYCRSRNTAEQLQCEKDPVQEPLVGFAGATHYLRLDRSVTLGVGLGYTGLWLLGRDEGPGLPGLLHGPRLTLQLLQTARRVEHFSDGRPTTVQCPELALELLFQDRFVQPRLVPSIAWSYWGVF